MTDKETFEDPLEEIDPVMEEAYSPSSVEDTAEQVEASAGSVATSVQDVSEVVFPDIKEAHQGTPVETGLFTNIPVQVSVELGRSTISLKEIFDLTEGSIVELDRLVGEPLDLVVNGQTVARGEVVAIDNNFGLRIKSIVSQPTL